MTHSTLTGLPFIGSFNCLFSQQGVAHRQFVQLFAGGDATRQIMRWSYWLGVGCVVLAVVTRVLNALGTPTVLLQTRGNAISFRSFVDGALLFLITCIATASTDILAGVDSAFELQRVKQKHGDVILNLRCFKHRQIEETTTTIMLNLEEKKFDLVSDASDVVSSDLIHRIQAVIARHPGITQKRLMRKAQLPETNGRKILHEGTGTHWRSKRGDGSTLHYYLKS